MRVKDCGVRLEDFVVGKPLDVVEFATVKIDKVKSRAPDEIPQANIGMTSGEPNCFGDGDKERFFVVFDKLSRDTELLDAFSPDSVGRVLAAFDVATWWEPELSLDMVTE